jgi:hypothetical protein
MRREKEWAAKSKWQTSGRTLTSSSVRFNSPKVVAAGIKSEGIPSEKPASVTVPELGV